MNLQALLQFVLGQIQNLGIWAPIAFIVTYTIATVALIPSSLLTLGAGALFGLASGFLYAFLGATLGATTSFLVGRYLARDWVVQKIAGHPKLQAIDAAVAKAGFKIVVLTRLSPMFPFVLLNYTFGITQVSLRDYVMGCLGIIPATLLYTYMGSLLGNVATLTAGVSERSRTPLEWAVYGLGLVATAIVTVYITQITRKALESRVS